MQKRSIIYSFVLMTTLLMSQSSWSFSPKSDFVQKESFGSVINYRFEKSDVDLSSMTSEFSYGDLTKDNVKELNELFTVKQEYGKVFGFNNWKAKDQKLIEENSRRIFLLQGEYKDAQNKTVHFLEVYWADNNKKSGQYLLTSNSKKISISDYKNYFQL